MRGAKEVGAQTAPGLPALAGTEALACRGGGKAELPDIIITIPPPPVAPVVHPLPVPQALACVGGDDPIKEVRAMIDWIIGKPPDPDEWPPRIV